MKELPKVTFTNNDHTKVKKAMTFYDPMKDMLKTLYYHYFDGRIVEEQHRLTVTKLADLVKYLD